MLMGGQSNNGQMAPNNMNTQTPGNNQAPMMNNNMNMGNLNPLMSMLMGNRNMGMNNTPMRNNRMMNNNQNIPQRKR